MKESTARIGDGRTDTHDRTGSEYFPSRWPEINNIEFLNQIQLQSSFSNICGEYCIFFSCVVINL